MNDRRNAAISGPFANNSILQKALAWISLSVLIGQAFALVLFFRAGMIIELLILALGSMPNLAAFELNRRGRTQVAGGIIALSLTLTITGLATAGAGIQDIAVMAYPAILILASLILRRNTTIHLTVLILACLAWLVFGEMGGVYLPRYPEQVTGRYFAITAMILVITAIITQILSETIRTNTIVLQHELNEKSRIEKSLRETEELYRHMVERTSVITYRDTAELESGTIYISPQIKDLLGYSQEEWVGNPKLWLEITHPDDLPSVRSMIATCLESGERTICEYRLLSKSGGWVWFRDESVLIKDKNGKPQYIHGALIEITDRKDAERKVQQREAILGAVAQTAQQLLKASNWRGEINAILKYLGEATGASHVYIFEHHKGPDDSLLSSQTYEWTAPGMTPELNNPIYQNTHLAPAVPGLEDWYTNLSGGKPFYGSGKQLSSYWKRVFEERGLKTLLDVPIFVNGNWWGIIGFDDFVNEMPWSQAEINALVAAAGNLGSAIERQQMDDALRASEEKFQRAFHHTYVSMAISRTTDNILLDVNDAFCKVTGYSREEAIGKRAGRDLKIWVNQADRDFIIHTLERQGYVDEYRAEFRRRNGEIGVGLLSAVNANIAGETCQIYTFYDISKINQLMDELKAKNEELQYFTYTVSHDLKAPLVTIAGFMGYLEQDARKGDIERMARDTQRINEAVTKMQRLLNELLELSRIGRMMNAAEEIPFQELAEEALKLVEGRLTARQVRVRVEADHSTVYGDRSRLVEVIQNLVDNAAKFMGGQPNPSIEIGVKHIEGNRLFYVQDNGMGIETEQHERVFGLFNKLDANTEGTGIGLALVKRIVEVHGGSIWVESEPGKGATFFFTLENIKPEETL